MFEFIGGTLTDKINEIKKKIYLFYPDSLFLKIWTYIILVLFAYTTLYVPYKIAFIETDDVI